MLTLRGKHLELLHPKHPDNLIETLLSIRHVREEDILREIIHDPLLLPDIRLAIERIEKAKTNHERVMIFGDYDVDGISSTAALFLFLRDELKLDVSYRLPHRVHDGYGIKSYHMDEIASTGSKLVITVDCGTKDIESIAHAKNLGLDVIITDHHSCPDVLPPSIAVINPRRSDSMYPFGGLSGSGVIWKVIHALSDYFFPEKTVFLLQKYVDIVSLGTVADCMPMVDENRTIVRRGILQSQQSHHPFFQTFVDTLKRPILTEEDIGFFVGPMLNAGGRITTPYQSIAALLSSSLDSFARIQDLISVNETRKGKSRDAFEKAIATVDFSEPMIIYIDEQLEHGILGLVAAKLCEIYHKPIGVFTLHEGHYVGSLRAPLGIDLVQILDASSGHLFRYGGHAGAAGCTIQASSMVEACRAFQEATQGFYGSHDATPVIRVDTVLHISDINNLALQSLESLRPFGQGFPAPVFLLQNISAPLVGLGHTGEHLRWDVSGDVEIIGFRMGEYREKLSQGPVHLVGTLKSHTWREKVTPQFHVIDAIFSLE